MQKNPKALWIALIVLIAISLLNIFFLIFFPNSNLLKNAIQDQLTNTPSQVIKEEKTIVQKGTDGRDGADGKDGINGLDGVNGTNGINGPTGVRGDKGDAGKTLEIEYDAHGVLMERYSGDDFWIYVGSCLDDGSC